MKLISWLYIAIATLLMLHEIESAYWREWEVLKLPGRITGFVMMHVPILVLLFAGMGALAAMTPFGLWCALVSGTAGIVPLLIHRFIVRVANRFNLRLSRFLLWTNAPAGIALATMAAMELLGS